MQKETQTPNVKLFFSCRKIKKASNYKVLFTQKGFWGLQETQSLEEKDPNFKKPVMAKYSFQKKQQCQICLKESKEGGDYWIINTTMNDIVGGRNSTKTFKIEHMTIIAKAQAMNVITEAVVQKQVTKTGDKEHIKQIVTEEKIKLGLRAKKVSNTDSIINFINKSDPFIRLHRIQSDGSLVKIFQSQHIKNTLNPKWKQIILPLPSLVDKDKKTFLVEVWDDEKDKPPVFIGSTQIKIDELQSGKAEFPLQHPKHKHPGKIKIYNFDISKTKNQRDYVIQTNYKQVERIVERQRVKQTAPTPSPTKPLSKDEEYYLKRFLSYKRGGLQLSSIVSIDFTKSNGDPSQKSSLHYAGGQKNKYLSALNSIIDVIKKFDSEQKIPLYGFGAMCQFPHFTKGDVQYLLPISGQADKPQVLYDDIPNVYKNSLKYLKFNGPTYVKPVIAEANRICSKVKSFKNFQKYLVLLVLTDGAVDDLGPVKKELQAAVNLPLTIILVGIGTGDFSGMKQLIQENKKLSRQVLQFFQYEKFKNNGELLAESILRNFPREVVTLMENKKIEPNDVDVDLSDIEQD